VTLGGSGSSRSALAQEIAGAQCGSERCWQSTTWPAAAALELRRNALHQPVGPALWTAPKSGSGTIKRDLRHPRSPRAGRLESDGGRGWTVTAVPQFAGEWTCNGKVDLIEEGGPPGRLRTSSPSQLA